MSLAQAAVPCTADPIYRFSKHLKAALFAASAVYAFPANAQITPVGSVPPVAAAKRQSVGDVQSDSTSAANEEIIVTAQRRRERLVDVPMSVVVASGEQLAKAGVVSIHDLSNVVSGVQINFAACCTQPSVRGISTLTTGPGFENNVAVYVDGFYQPDTVSINSDLANIGSVEVLKGPQGTLWGRNATGGAILINTLAPSKVFTGKLSASYGRFNDLAVGGYLSGPLSDAVRFSVAAHVRRSDGYNTYLDAAGQDIGDGTPVRQTSVRAKLEADVTSGLTATLGYNFGYTRDGRALTFTMFANTSPALPPSPPRASGNFQISNNRPDNNTIRTHEGTLKLALDVGIGTLTSYTGYARRESVLAFDFDGSWVDLSGVDYDFLQKTFQQAFDLNITSIDNLKLLVGASYYNDNIGNEPDKPQKSFAGGITTALFLTTLRAEALAGYVDATYNVTDQLEISLGARYTTELKRGEFIQFNGTGQFLYDGSNGKRFEAFTPRGSIRYEIVPDTSIYASYSQGFRSGGFQPNGAVSNLAYVPFRPEEITAYEVGFKSQRRRATFSLAAFYYDYRDLQVGSVVPNPNGSGTPVSQVVNAESAEVYGIDGDLKLRPTDDWNLNIGGAWLHARYKNFSSAIGTGLNAATGLNVAGQQQDWSGQQMTRAPNFTFFIGTDYTIHNVAGGSLNLGGNLRYTDSYVVNSAALFGPLAGADLAKQQRFRQSAYALLNIQANWTDASDRFSFGVFANNVTDKKYVITFNGSGLGTYSSYAAPATYGVRVGYNF